MGGGGSVRTAPTIAAVTLTVILVLPYGAIQVLRNADGGGEVCQIFREKALQRCKVQRY